MEKTKKKKKKLKNLARDDSVTRTQKVLAKLGNHKIIPLYSMCALHFAVKMFYFLPPY